MDGWLKALIAAACVVVIAAGGYYGWSEYQAAELAKAEQLAANDPAVRICEAVAKARLKSPASYRRIDARIEGEMVRISYDAVNSYNAPLRGYHTCSFEADDSGQINFAQSGDADEASENMKKLTADIQTARSDGSFQRKKRDFDRRYEEGLKATIDAMQLILIDHSAAKNTGIQPINPDATAVKAPPGTEVSRLKNERRELEAEQKAKADAEAAHAKKKSNCLDMAAELKLRTANSQSPSSLLDGLRRCVEVGTITADEIPDVRDLL